MNARIAIATRLGFREQARRPLLIALLVVVPFVFITKAIASTQAIPRRVGEEPRSAGYFRGKKLKFSDLNCGKSYIQCTHD